MSFGVKNNTHYGNNISKMGILANFLNIFLLISEIQYIECNTVYIDFSRW